MNKIQPNYINNIYNQRSYNYNDIKKEKNSVIQYFNNLQLTQKQSKSLLEVIEIVQQNLNDASLSKELVKKLENKIQSFCNNPKELIEKLILAATHDSSKIFYNKETKMNWFYFVNYTDSINKIITGLKEKTSDLSKVLKPYLRIPTKNMTSEEIIEAFKDFTTLNDPLLLFNAAEKNDFEIVKLFVMAGAENEIHTFVRDACAEARAASKATHDSSTAVLKADADSSAYEANIRSHTTFVHTAERFVFACYAATAFASAARELIEAHISTPLAHDHPNVIAARNYADFFTAAKELAHSARTGLTCAKIIATQTRLAALDRLINRARLGRLAPPAA